MGWTFTWAACNGAPEGMACLTLWSPEDVLKPSCSKHLWWGLLLRLGAGSELGPVRPLLEVWDAEDGPVKWETLQYKWETPRSAYICLVCLLVLVCLYLKLYRYVPMLATWHLAIQDFLISFSFEARSHLPTSLFCHVLFRFWLDKCSQLAPIRPGL